LCKKPIGVIHIDMILVIIAVLLGALALSSWWLGWVLLHKIDRIEPPTIPEPAPSFDDSELWKAIEVLTRAVADGIDHVDRNEKRVRGIITGAKRRFEAEGYVDPGVEAEIDTLPRDDEGGGGEEELQAVPEDVEPDYFLGLPGDFSGGLDESS